MRAIDISAGVHCKACDKTLPATLEFFYRNRRLPEYRRSGWHNWCRVCEQISGLLQRRRNGEAARAKGRLYRARYYMKNRERLLRNGRVYYLANPYRWHGYSLKKNHGITRADYEKLFAAQKGVCAICENPEVVRIRNEKFLNLRVDHDHSSGKIRGLLCDRCNKMIGYAQEDIVRLRRTIEYLGDSNVLA